MLTRILAATAGAAALAAAAPAAAQYGYSNNPYAANPYGYAHGYQQGRTHAAQIAAQQCAAAVQNRLNNPRSLAGVIGSMFGVNTATNGRVLSVTQVNQRRNTIRVRGLASSGQHAYSPYAYGAYGSLAHQYQPDLSFTCRADRMGRVRDVDIDRRR